MPAKISGNPIMRHGRPVSMRELINADGGAIVGSPDPCVHCGKEAREYEVITPRLGWVLMFWIPPVDCCSKNRRSRAS